MWERSKINNLCHILGGISSPSDNSGAFDTKGIPFVRMRDLGKFHLTTNLDKTDDIISFEYALEKNLKPIPKGAILLPRSGSVALNHRAILAQDSIIVSHICALIVKDENKINNRFLYYWLTKYDMNSIAKKTTGLDAINFSDLGNIEILFPDLETQNKIVSILDKANVILEKRERSVQKYEELLRAIFLEMFGDVPTNPKNLTKLPIKEFGEVITGNTPPRKDKTNYDSNFIEWIKTDNILSNNHLLTQASEYLSKKGFSKARYVEENSLLVTCIAGSINSISRAAISNRKVAFNQQINAIVPKRDVSVYFLYWMFKVSAEYIQSYATGGMKRILTKGEFEKVLLLKPSYADQLKFEQLAVQYNNLKSGLSQYQYLAEMLIKSLSQQAFSERVNIDIDIELEALIKEIDPEKKDAENKIKAIKNDLTLLQRLIDKLNEQDFETSDQYEKAKYVAFSVMKDEPNLIKQRFNSSTKKVALEV